MKNSIAQNLLAKAANPKTAAVMALAKTASENTRMKTNRQPACAFILDGLDHINIWENGRTQLGRALAMEEIHPEGMRVRGLGVFTSFFALWLFLNSSNRVNGLRNLPAPTLRAWYKTGMANGTLIDYPDSRYICVVALARWITSRPELAHALKGSAEVEFGNYIEISDKERIVHPQANWWVPAINLIRSKLITGEKFFNEDFAEWRDTDRSDDEIFKLPTVNKGVSGVIPKKIPENTRPVEREATACVREYEDFAVTLRSKYSDLVQRMTFPTPENRSEAMRMMLSLTSPDALKELITAGEFNQDELFELYVTYDAETFELQGVSTAIFNNPYDAAEPEVTEVSQDDFEEVARKKIGVSESFPMEAVRVHHTKTARSQRSRRNRHNQVVLTGVIDPAVQPTTTE